MLIGCNDVHVMATQYCYGRFSMAFVNGLMPIRHYDGVAWAVFSRGSPRHGFNWIVRIMKCKAHVRV